MDAKTKSEAQARYRAGVAALKRAERITGTTSVSLAERQSYVAIAMGHFTALERLSFWSDVNGVLPGA